MEPVRKILCAVDVFDFQPIVAERAVFLANSLNANITVVYVLPFIPESVYFAMEGYRQGEFDEKRTLMAKEKMAEIMSGHFRSDKDDSLVLVGSPVEEIIKALENVGGDLLIMGTHGRKGVGRVLHGSVAAKVLVASPVPVLTIRPQ